MAKGTTTSVVRSRDDSVLLYMYPLYYQASTISSRLKKHYNLRSAQEAVEACNLS